MTKWNCMFKPCKKNFNNIKCLGFDMIDSRIIHDRFFFESSWYKNEGFWFSNFLCWFNMNYKEHKYNANNHCCRWFWQLWKSSVVMVRFISTTMNMTFQITYKWRWCRPSIVDVFVNWAINLDNPLSHNLFFWQLIWCRFLIQMNIHCC